MTEALAGALKSTLKEAFVKFKETVETKIAESPLQQVMDDIKNKSLKSLKAENEAAIARIKTRNEELEGKRHPETGVPFKRKIVEVNGEKLEGTFPEFESKFDVLLPKELYKATDAEQFKNCNEQLKKEIETNSELRKQFSEKEIDQIKQGRTPENYTWHHNEEIGKMQLVDKETHAKTAHTGGASLWGSRGEINS